ncbi:MAG: MFS transporter [Gemmatimonadetes bacterium]|nr:MAG: MFS transporter [Gemmatimonadota bacterium]
MTEALPPRPAARRYGLGALSHRNFRLFFVGQGISLVGTWMQNVGEGWLILTLTNSPFYVGLTSALSSLGVLLFSLYAGVIADRVDKRRVIIFMQIAFMLEAFTVAILVWTGVVAVWQVLVLATILGIASAFDIPMRQSFLVEMVGKEDLMNAIALNSSVFNGARVIGPAIAGLLIGALGIAWCYFLNGLSYIAVIVGLLMMRLPPVVRTVKTTSTWGGFREVLTFLNGNRGLRSLMILTSILSVFGFPYISMMPVFARDVLHRGATGYGALTSSIGIGAVIGALGVALASSRIRRRGRLMLVGGTVFGILLILFSASRSLALSMVLLAFAGCAMIVNNSLTNTLLQTAAPDHLRGRIMGFYSFVFVGMAPFGAFFFGLVAEHIGAPSTIAGGGAIVAMAVVITGLAVPELRHT